MQTIREYARELLDDGHPWGAGEGHGLPAGAPGAGGASLYYGPPWWLKAKWLCMPLAGQGLPAVYEARYRFGYL